MKIINAVCDFVTLAFTWCALAGIAAFSMPMILSVHR